MMEPGLLQSSDWPLLIDLYFFLGGVAGGAFVIATIANFVDRQRYQDIVRIGYYVAFLALLPCPILLIADLGYPTRFLHMLMVSKPSTAIGMGAVTVGPLHLKPFSPMSAGAWGLLIFGLCTFLCALDVFLTDRGGRSLTGLRTVAGVAGSVFGFFIAAYPGVLLGATARPLFINAHWLGAVFLAVGAATGGAAIALILALLRGAGSREGLARVMRVMSVALVVELIALILFVVSVKMAGSAGLSAALGQLLAGRYGVPFWLGVVIIGVVAPLVLQRWTARAGAPGMAALVSVLVLIGGFLTKYVLIAAGQAS
jgi:formate-dependent nitrite reductase membrane component NrfD